MKDTTPLWENLIIKCCQKKAMNASRRGIDEDTSLSAKPPRDTIHTRSCESAFRFSAAAC